MKRLECYVRPYRRRWGLTQKELAYLLGSKSGTRVSRLERQERQPSLATAFACQVIFGIPPHELFPRLFTEVEEEVMRRAYDLHEQLQGDLSKATRTKLDLLEDLRKRAQRRVDDREV